MEAIVCKFSFFSLFFCLFNGWFCNTWNKKTYKRLNYWSSSAGVDEWFGFSLQMGSEVVSMDEGESIRLGGNIELAGFDTLNSGEMVVIKKIVGNYVRRMEGMCKDFSGLKLRMKPLHQTGEVVKKFELHGQLLAAGQVYPAEVVEHNLFVGVDAVLKKLVNGITG